ncbi:hypothetical protein SPI_04909 [Niveomyces insectorum RCEF 264]|uniref:Uncharacterized protein n=1 Tax=Niveomyces insectorum RCEF 264 TaxID=1081102 RepID=A0A167UZ12_9HYPO|nr:hypothetical protein SPI_04909 [Niveomyces insectorum RCEF 264]
MSAPTPSSEAELLALSAQAKNFIPLAADKRPSVFLSLAPATSNSYPQPKKASAAAAAAATADATAVSAPVSTAPSGEDATATAAAAAAVTDAATTDDVAGDVKQRRSSSLSSTHSNKRASGLRFLKLGPVHWGEHLDDHQQDWCEAAIE